jgi:hypothetical protein
MSARIYYEFFYRTLRQIELFPDMQARWSLYRALAPQIADAAEKSFQERGR